MPIVHSSTLATLSSYYRSGSLAGKKLYQTPQYPPSPELNARIAFTKCSITDIDTTCVVNAANTSLLGGAGVDGAIHRGAGPALLQACRKLNGCETGSAKITDGYHLPAKHIIHCVGPMYEVEKSKRPGSEKQLLQSCYKTALELAKATSTADQKASIAFPCLSTGIYGYPADRAAYVALKEVRRWMENEGKDSLALVVFVLFEQKDTDAYEKFLPRVFPPTTDDLVAGGLKARPLVQKNAEKKEGEEKDEWEKVESPVSTESDEADWEKEWVIIERIQAQK